MTATATITQTNAVITAAAAGGVSGKLIAILAIAGGAAAGGRSRATRGGRHALTPPASPTTDHRWHAFGGRSAVASQEKRHGKCTKIFGSQHARRCVSACFSAALPRRTARWTPVSGPVVGFVFERPAGIRPILGVPGAATLGQPVSPGPALSPSYSRPLVTTRWRLLSRGRQVVLLTDLSSSSRFVELPVRPGAGRIAISPSGDAAALYYPETQPVAVLTGLPDSPAVSWRLEVPYIDGSLAALAVSDGGGAVLIAGVGEQSPVWLLHAGSGAQFLSYVSTLPSLAFLARSADALIADGGAGSIMLVRDTKGQPEITQIGGAAEGISRPWRSP